MRESILIFGGTFDPPHRAHITLPQQVATQLGCSRIIYVPAAINPHKLDRPPTSAEHRLAMLTLALADVPNADISTIELQRPGPSYTIDTLRAFRRDLGDDVDLRLLIGADQALAFHQWKDWREILALATPAVILRPPMDEATFHSRLAEKYDESEARLWRDWLVIIKTMNASSSDIRARLQAGRGAAGLIDPAVAQYIAENKLYR